MNGQITEADLMKLTKQNGTLEELGRIQVWASKQSPEVKQAVGQYVDRRVQQEIEK